MMGKVLLILGGMFHDFEGFAKSVRPLVEGAGYSLEATYDLDSLLRLESGAYDVLMSYTSLSRHREGLPANTPESLTAEQTSSLVQWVHKGGAFLGIHSATVMGQDNPALRSLLGGRFIEHPPQFVFQVCPMAHAHPITAGVEAFSVKDELYIHDYDPSLDIHMITVDRGVAYPMVWSKAEGRGRVAYIAPGHSDAAWSLPAFQRLVLQALTWLTQG